MTSYYVNVNGSDNNSGTSPSNPFQTIQKATNIAIGRDSVFISGGTYKERVNLSYRTNTSYITISNYNSEEVIVDGTGIDIQYGQGLINVYKMDFIKIYGLKVQHSNGTGIYVAYSNNIDVSNNITYDTVKSGIGIWYCDNAIANKNYISLACNAHANYPASEENISIAGCSNVEVGYNLVNKASNIPNGYSGGEGINVKSGSHDVKIHHNIVHLDERPDGLPTNRLAYGLDAWDAPTYNIEYYSNIAYNSLWGFIVSSEQGGTVENVKVYNNVAYNITQAGLAIPWWSGTKDAMKTDVQFINNTVYNSGFGFINQSPSNKNIIVRNNIFNKTKTPVQLLSGSESQFTIDHNILTEDPLFVNANVSDFHLQSTSPAIDKGSSTNSPLIDFDGKSRDAIPDIGAFEFIKELNFMTVIDELNAVIANLTAQQEQLATKVTELTAMSAGLTDQINAVKKAISDLAEVSGLVDQLNNLI